MSIIIYYIEGFLNVKLHNYLISLYGAHWHVCLYDTQTRRALDVGFYHDASWKFCVGEAAVGGAQYCKTRELFCLETLFAVQMIDFACWNEIYYIIHKMAKVRLKYVQTRFRSLLFWLVLLLLSAEVPIEVYSHSHEY